MIGSLDTSFTIEKLGLIAAASAFIISVALIIGLHPLLVRYALARPNARSSHRVPTPQGGGIAVIGAVTAVLAGVAIFAPGGLHDPGRLSVILACTITLAVVGATDDIRPLEALPRLLLQVIAMLVVIAMLPAGLRVFYILPWWFERALMFVAGLWFVNLVNFMDGIDWMTVAEVLPLSAALALFGAMGALPHDAMIVALALCGAMIGFAPFNRPMAKLFLGDVGSLPIGLLLSWMLILLAGSGHIAAALLLPLYYLADATITLLRRIFNREQILQAHRSHFYQRAADSGFTVYQIVSRVFAVNIALASLATLTLLNGSFTIHIVALVGGSALVGALLWKFNRIGQSKNPSPASENRARPNP